MEVEKLASTAAEDAVVVADCVGGSADAAAEGFAHIFLVFDSFFLIVDLNDDFIQISLFHVSNQIYFKI